MDMEKVKAFIESNIAGVDLTSWLAAPADDQVIPLQGHIQTIIAQLEVRLADGFQLSDLSGLLGDVTAMAMALAKQYGEDGTGPKKKEFVISLVKTAYILIDRGVDGTKNRIDIPFIPNLIERTIEMKILEWATSFAIEAAYSGWLRAAAPATEVNE